MTEKPTMKVVAALCGACLLAVSYCASAQIRSPGPGVDYPSKPIRGIVVFAPGGGADFIGRTVAARLTETLRQPVIIDNRTGAGGVVGTELGARADPDGYTLLFGGASAFTVAPALGKVPYDPVKDFAPISMLGANPQVLVVNNMVPVNSLKELIALAKSKPGQLNFASGGQGSIFHLAGELLKIAAGVDMVHVPYKGGSPAMVDLLAGQVQLMFNTMPTVMPLVKSGKLKALAVSSAQRSRAAPDIPTVTEAGVPSFEPVVSWYGLFAPAKTPQAIITKLNGQLKNILTEPEMIQRLASQGADTAPGTPESLAAYIRVEFERFKKVIKAGEIKPM